MGDPKLPKKKYKTPSHPWQKARIEEEKVLMKEYGLRNKKEIWKMVSVMKSFHQQAKSLIVSKTAQADKERVQMMEKLASYGLVAMGSDLDDVLGLTVRSVMDRRLQTQVVKLGLARSYKQARHFIVHRHIMVDDKVITSPSYLVTSSESGVTKFAPRSKLSDPSHTAREMPAAKPEIPDDAATKKAPEKPAEPKGESK